MSDSPQKIDPKKLQEEIKGKIRGFYPYLLGFYLLSLIISIFSDTWFGFFYWPSFHGVVIFFSILFILTFKFNFRFKRVFKIKNIKIEFGQQIIGLVKNSARQANRQVRKYLILVCRRLKGMDRKTWLKIIIIAAILIFSLIKNIGVLDFLTLFYALISFFFIFDSRIAAGGALVLLASCPFFLIFKEDSLAENAAIYAYYFLVITVLTQIREMKKEEKEAKL